MAKAGLVQGFLGSYLVYVMSDKSFFSVFLYLELCVMGFFFSLSALGEEFGPFGEMGVIFLVIKICEAALGLGILVSLARAAVKNYENGGIVFNMFLTV